MSMALGLFDGVNRLQDFLVLWKASGIVLAVDQLPVDFHIEDAPTPLDHLTLDAHSFPNRLRQTGGLRCVISLNAVLDRNLHRRAPFE